MAKLTNDVKDSSGKWLKGFSIGGVEFRTQSAVKWYSMLSRCSHNYADVYSSYRGCAVSDTFKDFQLFTDWHTKQVAYGISGYDMDKDFIGCGKIYSESNCVLIPQALNKFLTYNTKSNSGLPIGVDIDKRYGDRYRTSIRTGESKRYLGTFRNLEDAGEAWIKAKKIEATRWMHRLLAGEFIVDSRVIDALEVWEPRFYTNSKQLDVFLLS